MPAAIVVGLAVMTTPGRGETGYHEPLFQRPLFDTEQLSLSSSDYGRILDSLLAVARSEGVDATLKSKIVAFAYALADEKERVIEVNFHLTYGLPFASGSTVRPGGDWATFVKVVELGDGTVRSLATTYFQDLVGSIDPALKRTEGTAPDWSLFVPGLAKEAMSTAETTLTESFALSEATVGGVFFTGAEVTEDESGAVTRWNYLSQSMKATSLTAEVSPSGMGPSTINILGEFPPQLHSALGEVVKMFSLRNVTIPPGNQVNVQFEGGYSGADGPSAALACALLVDALVQGTPLDPAVAPIGDLNADGSVQPVYNVRGRLLANRKSRGGGSVKLMAIPKGNLARLGDVLLVDGVMPLLDTQVFTVETFDDAKALAIAPNLREKDLAESLRIFGEVEAAARTAPGNWLLQAEVQSRLRKVLELTPGHASARMLLLKAVNRAPKQLTLSGSLEMIQHGAVFLNGHQSPKFDDFRAASRYLSRNQEMFHPESLSWMKAILDCGTVEQRASGSLLSNSQRAAMKGQMEKARNRV
ncbi:MAG: hypothetical protein AAF191_13865, partial [Verrucomicrobiota bacterium]